MPFDFDQKTICSACRRNGSLCFEDRRRDPVPNRATKFRITQQRLIECAFEDFVPGSDGDPNAGQPFGFYLDQMLSNVRAAGEHLVGAEFALNSSAVAKVHGDVFEVLEAAALWNAASTWNRFMDTGEWPSDIWTMPDHAVATPTRKVGIVQLPRGYDATRLFRHDVRQDYSAFQESLAKRDLVLDLSSPDIVCFRLPVPSPPACSIFSEPIGNLRHASRQRIEAAHQAVEGLLEGRSFLAAIAVKTSTRSDRLYQPLFEANVLKFLIGYVLRGSAFRFHVHMLTLEGADVRRRYRAASLTSLMLGGEPTTAVDCLHQAVNPVETAQLILDELPGFPL